MIVLSKKLIIILLVIVFLGFFYYLVIDDNEPVSTVMEQKKVALKGTSFENLKLPENYDIRQYEGTSLTFIVENNLHANILQHESQTFTELTGIDIKIKALDYDSLVQKINLDFIAEEGRYQIVYVDPYQTLNRFFNYLEPLDYYQNSDDFPTVDGLAEDFFAFQKEVVSHFATRDITYSIPFDSTTMILYYRKDVFDKYRDAFKNEKGYDWTPDQEDFTWEKYIEVSEWINENVPDWEVKYGSGHMAKAHNSVFCDFSNVLAAYGGEYFGDEGVNTIGVTEYEEILVKEDAFQKALEVYKEIISAAHPDSANWDWTDSAEAFRNGTIAMMPNWDENISYLEKEGSKVAGKVGYAMLPTGDVRSASIFGGSGIGINKYAKEVEKEAAWLYIVWATSSDIQYAVFDDPEGGSLPTRRSFYVVEDGIITDQNDYVETVFRIWDQGGVYLRPQITNFYFVEGVLINELNAMIQEDLSPEVVSQSIYRQLDDIQHGE